MTTPARHDAARSGVLPLFRRGGWYQSADTAAVPGGLRISLAPTILVVEDARWQRSALTSLPAFGGRAERVALLADALDMFAHGSVDVAGLGRQSTAEFLAAMHDVAGLPAALTQRWCDLLREQLRTCPEPAQDELTLVSLPGNTFTCLAAVAEAIARGGAVWIRPSRKEPLSAARFAAALLAAGLPPQRLGVYPSTAGVLRTLIDRTDRQVVYGGAQLAASVPDRSSLALHGPGRGCAVVAAGTPAADVAPWLRDLVAADSGRFCTSVCTVLCADDPAPVADALGALLDEISLDPVDARWPVAAIPDPALAGRLAGLIADRLRSGDRVVTRRPTLVAGRRTFLAPTLVELADPEASPLLGLELPFPFATVARAGRRLTEAVTSGSLYVYHSAQRPSREEQPC